MRPLSIFYLDDEPAICQLFIDNFASDQCSVKTFKEPDALIKAVNESQPDLVIMDFRMPSMSGEEVAALLPTDVPKALVTGDLSLQASANFSKVFYKPYDFDEMEAFIHSHIKRESSAG